jgi:UDP-N-acetylglucosamine/UDP-N-acetylgalactosamine 4-epimerase
MYENSYHGNEDISGYTFLVTGGAGFIGSHITEYLLRQGAGEVRVLDNLATGYQHNIDYLMSVGKVNFINGDITDLATCHNACKGVDFVLHQAALGSVPRSLAHPELTTAANVTGFVNMLIAAKDSGVKRLVYASSSSVYGDIEDSPKVEERIGKQLSPYAVTKYTNELFAQVFHRCYGLEIIGLRYFNIFGPRQNPNGAYAAVIPKFIAALLNEEPVYIDGDGGQTRDFTFVANAVQANIKALFAQKEAVNEVYNIAVGENFSLNQMYTYLQELTGKQQAAINRETRPGDVRNALANISKAQKLMGYNPEYTFQQGLAKTVESYQAMAK